MVKSKLKIVIKRDSEERALVSAIFRGHKYFGELVLMPVYGPKKYCICNYGTFFFKPYIGMLFNVAKNLKIDGSDIFKVNIDI